MNQTLPQEQKKQQLIQFEKTLGDSVQNRIAELSNSGRLNLPANYSVGNALQSAWLILQDLNTPQGESVLKVCTQASIANALLDMSVLGLNAAKKQGYFIPYGKNLTWFTSYFGKAAVIKRLKGIETEPIGTLIYDGDEIELGLTELSEEIVLSHKKSWKSKLNGNIVGAYATVMQGKVKRSAVMTMTEIREAWTKNPSKGNKRDHLEFTGEFAKRTVINRLVKMILQTSNDDDLLAETMIANEEQHYEFEGQVVERAEEKAQLEIATNANTGEVVDIPTEVENHNNFIQESIPEEVPTSKDRGF